MRVTLMRPEVTIENDDGRFLALADLCALLLPLTICAPEAMIELLAICRCPKGDSIDAAIGVLAFDIGGTFD